jgi:UPF0716 family protein affecting phage T7 exclusion
VASAEAALATAQATQQKVQDGARSEEIQAAEAALAAAQATVVIGGLFTSTLLTLLIVPVMYKTLDPLTSFGRKQTKKAETPPTDQE